MLLSCSPLRTEVETDERERVAHCGRGDGGELRAYEAESDCWRGKYEGSGAQRERSESWDATRVGFRVRVGTSPSSGIDGVCGSSSSSSASPSEELSKSINETCEGELVMEGDLRIRGAVSRALFRWPGADFRRGRDAGGVLVGSSSAPYLACFSGALTCASLEVLGRWLAFCDGVGCGVVVSPSGMFTAPLGVTVFAASGTADMTGALNAAETSERVRSSSDATVFAGDHDAIGADVRLLRATELGVREFRRGGMAGNDADGGGVGGVYSIGTRMLGFFSGDGFTAALSSPGRNRMR